MPRAKSLPTIQYNATIHNAQLQNSCKVFSSQNRFLADQLLLQSKQQSSNDQSKRERLLQLQVINQMKQIKQLNKQLTDEHDDYQRQLQKSTMDNKFKTLESQLFKSRKINSEQTEKIKHFYQKADEDQQKIENLNAKCAQLIAEHSETNQKHKDRVQLLSQQLTAKDKYVLQLENRYSQLQKDFQQAKLANQKINDQLATAENYQNIQETEFLEHFKQLNEKMETDETTTKLSQILKCNFSQIVQQVIGLKDRCDLLQVKLDKEVKQRNADIRQQKKHNTSFHEDDKKKKINSKREPEISNGEEKQEVSVIKSQNAEELDEFESILHQYNNFTVQNENIQKSPKLMVEQQTNGGGRKAVLNFDMNIQTDPLNEFQAQDQSDIINLLKEYFNTEDDYQLPVLAKQLTTELGRTEVVAEGLMLRHKELTDDYKDLIAQLQQQEKYYTRNDVRIFLYKLQTQKLSVQLKEELAEIIRSLV